MSEYFIPSVPTQKGKQYGQFSSQSNQQSEKVSVRSIQQIKPVEEQANDNQVSVKQQSQQQLKSQQSQPKSQAAQQYEKQISHASKQQDVQQREPSHQSQKKAESKQASQKQQLKEEENEGDMADLLKQFASIPVQETKEEYVNTNKRNTKGLLDWDIKETHHSKPGERPKSAQTLIQAKNYKKDKTNDYFQETKIESCSYVVVKNGVPMAMPCYSKPPQTFSDLSQKMSVTSSTAKDSFAQRKQPKAGDRKKPLEPYNPNSFRNRLPQPTIKMPHKNHSTLQLGDPNVKDKDIYKSTNNNFQGKSKNL